MSGANPPNAQRGAVVNQPSTGRSTDTWPHQWTNRYGAGVGTAAPQDPTETLALRVSDAKVLDATGAVTTATPELTRDRRTAILLRVFHGLLKIGPDNPILRMADLEFIGNELIEVEITTYNFGDAAPQPAAYLTTPALTQFTKETRKGAITRATRGYEMDWGSLKDDEGRRILLTITQKMQDEALLRVKRLVLHTAYSSPRFYTRMIDFKNQARDLQEYYGAQYRYVGILNGCHDGQGMARLVDRAIREATHFFTNLEFCIVPPGVKTALSQSNPNNWEYWKAGPDGPDVIKEGHRRRVFYDNLEVVEDDSEIPGTHDAFYRHGASIHETAFGQSYPLVMPSEFPPPTEWRGDRQSIGINVYKMDNFAKLTLSKALAESGCFRVPSSGAGGDENNVTDAAPNWMKVGGVKKLNFNILFRDPRYDADEKQSMTNLVLYMAYALKEAKDRTKDRTTGAPTLEYSHVFVDGHYTSKDEWTATGGTAVAASSSRVPEEAEAGEASTDASTKKGKRREEKAAGSHSKKRRAKAKGDKEEAVGISLAGLDDEEADVLRAMEMAEEEADETTELPAAGARTEEAEAAGAPPESLDAMRTAAGISAAHAARYTDELFEILSFAWSNRTFANLQALNIPIPMNAWVFRLQVWLMGDTLFCEGDGRYVKAYMNQPQFHQGKNVAALKYMMHMETGDGVHPIDPAKGMSFANTAWIRYLQGGGHTFLNPKDYATREFSAMLKGDADLMVVPLPPTVRQRDIVRYVPIHGEVDTVKDFGGAIPPAHGIAEVNRFLHNTCKDAFKDMAGVYRTKGAMNPLHVFVYGDREKKIRSPREMMMQYTSIYPVASHLTYSEVSGHLNLYVPGFDGTGDAYPGSFQDRDIDHSRPPPLITAGQSYEYVDII